MQDHHAHSNDQTPSNYRQFRYLKFYLCVVRYAWFNVACTDVVNRFYLTVYDVINYNDVISAINSYKIMLMENVLFTKKIVKKFQCSTLILITYWSTLVMRYVGYAVGVYGTMCRLSSVVCLFVRPLSVTDVLWLNNARQDLGCYWSLTGSRILAFKWHENY